VLVRPQSHALVLAAAASVLAASCSKDAATATTTTPAALTIVVPRPRLFPTETTTVRAVLLSSRGDSLGVPSVTWSSTDGGFYGSVSASGLVTAVHAGMDTVIAQAVSPPLFVDTAYLTIEQVTSLVMAPDTGTLSYGDSLTLSARAWSADGQEFLHPPLVWFQYDRTLTSVSAGGVLHVVEDDTGGPDSVLVLLQGARDVGHFVVRRSAVDSVAVAAAATMTAGDIQTITQQAFTAAGHAVGGRPVRWSVSDTSIATLVGDTTAARIMLRAVGGGTVTIRADVEGVVGAATVAVSPLGPYVSIAAGQVHTCGLTAAGAAYCWGVGDGGELGAGSGPSDSIPHLVVPAPAFGAIAPGGAHTCALTAAGDAYCWGDNYAGQVGAAALGVITTPTLVSGGFTFSFLKAGPDRTCGIVRGTGTLRCWGNTFGIVPDSIAAPAFVAVSMHNVAATTFVDLCGVTAAGAVYCWGDNRYGQLGVGDSTNRAAPTLVVSDDTFMAVSAGRQHTCALTTDGRAFCWGSDGSGALGGAVAGDAAVPRAVNTSVRFTAIGVGTAFACALAVDGTAWCWGKNSLGQLGYGGTAGSSRTLRAVPGLRFTALAVGREHACGLADDGRAYCWGGNLYGQLGNATFTDQSLPVRVFGQP